MKRLSLLLVAITLAITSHATPAASRELGFYGIWWNPTADGTDNLGGIGVVARRSVIPVITIDGRLGWVSGGGLNVVPVEATATIKVSVFYGGLGYGYYVFSGDNAPDDDFGWYVLGGVSLIPGPISVFGEIKWLELDTDGVELDAVGVHAGVFFSF